MTTTVNHRYFSAMRKSFICLMAATALCVAAPFQVTENGKPAAEIILDAKADKILHNAADELQHWVKEITGAELTVKSVPTAAPRRIHLTTSETVRAKYPDDAAKLKGNDGYAVRVSGDDLYIIGSVSKGVLNGVYRMLQRNTDILWARPEEEYGTFFTAKPSLVLRDNDYIDIPVFNVRGWKSATPLIRQDLIWSARNACNWTINTADQKLRFERFDWGFRQEIYGGHNVIGGYMPRSMFWEKHPEWYSMRNGKRVDPVTLPTGQIAAQLCVTNQEMVKEFCKQLSVAVNRETREDCFGVCMEDQWIYCECPECLAPIKLPDGRVLTKDDTAFQSTRYFLFINQLARYLKEKHPGKSIMTYAYLYSEFPPAIQVEDNVRVTLCPAFKNVKQAVNTIGNQFSWDRLKGWGEQQKNCEIILYEYYGYSGDYPRAIDRTVAADLRLSAMLGVNGIHSEVGADADRPSTWYRGTQRNVWDNNVMYFWIVNQLYWNPYQDVNALRREFLMRVFGAAADDVADYLACTERAWLHAKSPSTYSSNGGTAWNALGDLGLIPRVRDAIARARSRDLSPKSRTLLERLVAFFEQEPIIMNYERCKKFSLMQRENPSKYPNAVPNGDFEEGSDKMAAGAAADWNKTGLKAWSFWKKNAKGGFGVAKGEGVNNSTCVYLEPAESACFVQGLKLQAGDSYIARCKIRVDNLTDGRATLGFRWRNAKNDGWELHHDLPFVAAPKAVGEWCVVEGQFTVPENVSELSFQLGCSETTGRVYFDDVELYKVE